MVKFLHYLTSGLLIIIFGFFSSGKKSYSTNLQQQNFVSNNFSRINEKNTTKNNSDTKSYYASNNQKFLNQGAGVSQRELTNESNVLYIIQYGQNWADFKQKIDQMSIFKDKNATSDVTFEFIKTNISEKIDKNRSIMAINERKKPKNKDTNSKNLSIFAVLSLLSGSIIVIVILATFVKFRFLNKGIGGRKHSKEILIKSLQKDEKQTERRKKRKNFKAWLKIKLFYLWTKK